MEIPTVCTSPATGVPRSSPGHPTRHPPERERARQIPPQLPVLSPSRLPLPFLIRAENA